MHTQHGSLSLSIPAAATNKAAFRDLPLLLAAATLFVLAALYCWDPSYRHADYATADGEQRTIELADGSRVTLDAATRIDVDLHLRTRRVAVREGHALFALKPIAYAPFVVSAGTTTLRTAHAAFELRVDGDEVSVSVAEGRLEVRRD